MKQQKAQLLDDVRELIQLEQLKYDISRAEIALQGLLNRIESRG